MILVFSSRFQILSWSNLWRAGSRDCSSKIISLFLAPVIETPKSSTQHSGGILINMAVSALGVMHFASVNAPNILNVIILLEMLHTLRPTSKTYLKRKVQ